LVVYRRGMGNFVHNLLAELAQIEAPHQYYLYVDTTKASEVLPQDERFTIKMLHPRFYPVWEQVSLPLQVKHDQLDILYCPANTAPIWLPSKTKLVMTIHDVMYMLPPTILPLSPSLYQQLGRQYRRWIVPRAARGAAAIISDSIYSKSDTIKLLALQDNQIHVVYGSHGSTYKPLDDAKAVLALKSKLGLFDRIIVGLGAIDPRKNTARVIEAFAQLLRSGYPYHQLVLIGLNAQAKARFSQQCQRLEIVQNVLMLDYITEEELVTLYNTAEMVVYLSLYEGFGLPVLEAMACGVPVISSNTTSIPEIAKDAALLVDPTSTTAIAEAMAQLAGDKLLRQSFIVRGYEQAAHFSWPQAAQKVLSIIEQVN